jgi:multiple sugar transport system substrate-binding protein
VRPRVAGYIPFQSAASALVREAVAGERPAREVLDEIDRLYADLTGVAATAITTEPPTSAIEDRRS